MAALTNEQIIEAIKEKTILELSDLIKSMEEVFGVTAAAPVAVVAGGAAGGAAPGGPGGTAAVHPAVRAGDHRRPSGWLERASPPGGRRVDRSAGGPRCR